MKELKRPLVSVLMTAYNREKYIAEAIESVIASTYQDWELIIVDDCSTDKTVEIAKSYENKDSRIKVYVNEKNLGQFPNRNKAASYAKSKYLKYLDSDDIIYPQGLKVMIEALDLNPSAGLALLDVYNTVLNYPALVKKEDAIREYFTQKPFLIVGPSGVIFSKNAFNKVGGFGSDNYVGNDTKILMKIALMYDVVKIHPNLIYWREHDGQEFKKGVETNEYCLHDDDVIKEILFHPLCPLTNSEKRAALARLRNLHIYRALKFLKQGRMPICITMLKKALIAQFNITGLIRASLFANMLILKILRLFNGRPVNTFLSGKGIILAFHRVVESKISVFNGILEISQERFEFTINSLKRHNYDFISLNELPERLKSKARRKFAIITFDDGYKDNFTLAYPILKKHQIPFTIYLTTSFPDETAVLWWYFLEDTILDKSSLSFSYGGSNYHHDLFNMSAKQKAFDSIRRFIINSSPFEVKEKVKAILGSDFQDMYSKTKELAMSWDEIKILSSDPLVNIGNHTANHYSLASLGEEEIKSEIFSSQKLIESQTGVSPKHFAYPFGSRHEVNMDALRIIKDAGFITAATTMPGNIFSEHLDDDMFLFLPRYLISEKISKYALNIRLNGIYPFLSNGYSLKPKPLNTCR